MWAYSLVTKLCLTPIIFDLLEYTAFFTKFPSWSRWVIPPDWPTADQIWSKHSHGFSFRRIFCSFRVFINTFWLPRPVAWRLSSGVWCLYPRRANSCTNNSCRVYKAFCFPTQRKVSGWRAYPPWPLCFVKIFQSPWSSRCSARRCLRQRCFGCISHTRILTDSNTLELTTKLLYRRKVSMYIS